jgi:hypothetical protein
MISPVAPVPNGVPIFFRKFPGEPAFSPKTGQSPELCADIVPPSDNRAQRTQLRLSLRTPRRSWDRVCQNRIELLDRGVRVVGLEELGRFLKVLVNCRSTGAAGLCGMHCERARKKGRNKTSTAAKYVRHDSQPQAQQREGKQKIHDSKAFMEGKLGIMMIALSPITGCQPHRPGRAARRCAERYHENRCSTSRKKMRDAEGTSFRIPQGV